jgi:hypothetical protein
VWPSLGATPQQPGHHRLCACCCCRYPWPLLWPLLAQLMQEQLAKYEESEHVEVRSDAR